MRPQIYVVELDSYNSGQPYGNWIDASLDADQIKEEIQTILKESPEKDAEEWAIHAYEDFEGTENFFGENPDIQDISEAGKFIEEKGEIAALLISNYCGNISEAKNALANKFIGEYDSMEKFAQAKLDERTDIPADILPAIDMKYLAREHELEGIYYSLDSETGSIYMFYN